MYQIRPSVRSVNQIIGSTSTAANASMPLAKSRTVENAILILPTVKFVKTDSN